MIALLLVLGLFLYLTFIGQAVISLLRPRLGVLWSWFIAPTIGFAVLILIETRLNVWGYPVAKFGPTLTLALAVFAIAVFVWRRPHLPWRQLAPYLLITVGYLIYVGWPALRFGFNWISYGNDDMANYCLAADRFLQHGYYDLPLQSDLEGRDYAQHYWFMHGLQQIRPGSELAVAWVASITHLKAHQVFMPTILFFSMMQIFALCSIAVYKGRYRKTALIGIFLFATSPLFGLGTLYQLIAQVAGIAILLASASVLLTTRFMSWRKMVVGGLITGAMAIVYPEVSPFVALSIILFALRLRYTQRDQFNRYALFIVGVAVLTFLLIATNTYEFINTLVMQSVGSAGLGAMAEINDQSGGLVLFPWTLVPSFIPMLFGLHPFGKVGVDPLISILVLTGFAFLVYTVWRAWRNFMKGAPAGYIAAVMLPLGTYLFFKGQDFGLFKLAMFAQPIITLFVGQGFAYFVFRGSFKARRYAWCALAFFFLFTTRSSFYYSYASLGTYGGGLTEVVGASKLGVEFTPPTDLKYGGIESDINNVVTAKMLAQYTQGIDTRFLSRSYMDNIANIAVLKFLRTPNPDLGPQARIIEKLSLLRFLLPQEIMTGDVPDYRVMTINKVGTSVTESNDWTETSSRHLDYGDRLFVSVRRELDHFNKANPGEGWKVQNMYQYKLESQVKDHLIFVHSFLSPHYYSSARFRAAFFQREPEPYSDGEMYFHGTGRFTLFRIMNPSPNLRMIIDFSRTSLGRSREKLPDKAILAGDRDYKLPFVGFGSARIVSPIFKPEYYEKEAFITLDFNDVALPIEKEKTGLMLLYGRKYNLDDRRLVGFTRDISVITQEQYEALPRPTKIANFPTDLYRYKGLEYSGLYEDGWMADDAYLKLGASHPGQVLRFKGFVPDIPKFKTDGVNVTISINNTPTEIVNLKAGEFDLPRLIKEASAITTISLHFSDSEKYGDDDPRKVSAFVEQVSIDDIADFSAFKQITNKAGEKFTLSQVDDDGWIGQNASFKTPVFPDFKVLKLDLEMPGWAPNASNKLTVLVNGQPFETDVIPKANYQSVIIPLEPNVSTNVELKAENAFPLPNEKRSRSFVIKNLSVENLSPTDLFSRGWSPTGYRFKISNVDEDGWVDKQVAFTFPATKHFKQAIVRVVRFPSRLDLPVTTTVNGKPGRTAPLPLETPYALTFPLASDQDTTVSIDALQAFPLGAPDTRVRSYRIVGIDFK